MIWGLQDGAWYTEHHDNTFVTVSQIFMEWDQFFDHQDNIWQTLIYVEVIELEYMKITITIVMYALRQNKRPQNYYRKTTEFCDSI